MNSLIRQNGMWRSGRRGAYRTHSAYPLIQSARRTSAATTWMSLAMFVSGVIGTVLVLRTAAVLLGLAISPAAAAEFSDMSLSPPSTQLSQSQGGAGSADDLAAAMIVPNVFVGPIGVLAAADGSNAGPANVPAMQLAFNAVGGGIATMINYPFGFWCSDNFRVLAGTDATNLNRLCTGSVSAAGAGIAARDSKPDETPPDTVFGPCESVEVLSQQSAKIVLTASHIESGESNENSLSGGVLGGSGFRAATVQQNNGTNSKQQGTNTIGGAFGSMTF